MYRAKFFYPATVSTRISFDPNQRASTPLPCTSFDRSGLIYRAGALLCVLLVCLTSFVAVAHFHANDLGSTDRSCSLCALAHTGVALNNIATPAPIFVPSVPAETPAIVSHSFLPLSLYYIRPPPQV